MVKNDKTGGDGGRTETELNFHILVKNLP